MEKLHSFCIPPLFYLCSLFLLPVFSLSAQELELIQEAEGLRVMKNDQPIFFYQTQTKSKAGEFPRANYLHPVYGLNGEVLTEDFPDDHLHQRGIFWAWHQFIVEEQQVADLWDCRGIKWEVKKLKYVTKG